jgi:hypothetical protein
MKGEPPKKSEKSQLFDVHPANLLRLAYSSNKVYLFIYFYFIYLINYGSANTIGFMNVHILNRQSRSKR